jgi:hypothetical protein
MDTDSCDYVKQKKEHRDNVPNDSDIPEPIWVRRTFCVGDEVVRGLLDYNVYLLCLGAPIFLGILLFA